MKLLTAIGTLVGAMAFMFYYSVLLMLVFLAFTVVSLSVTKAVAKKNLECAADRQRALAYLTGIAEEYYTGRDVIRAYNHEQESIETVNTAVDELRAATKKTDFLTNCVNPLIRMLSRLSQAAIMLLACHWMLQGRMSLGVVQAFFQYMNMAAEPLTETSYMINSLQAALASAELYIPFPGCGRRNTRIPPLPSLWKKQKEKSHLRMSASDIRRIRFL
ncbi:MAG: ABC transporter transmembrane domain-containing protein [Clostridia bacterium]